MENMIPSSSDLNHQCFMLILTRLMKGKVEYFKNVHPNWDCQPWNDGYMHARTWETYTVGYHDELSSSYAINARLLPATLHAMHPSVVRWPTRKAA